MERTPLTVLRNRAYELADTGKFWNWPRMREALALEGGDNLLIRLLDGDGYFKFRLRQRMAVAQRTPNA